SQGGDVPLTLEMRVGSSAASMAGTATSARGGALVTVDEVKLLLKTIKFTRVDDDEELDFKSEAVAVTLDLNGSSTSVAVSNIPPDAYKRITFVIHKPEDTEPIPDPEFRDGPSGNQRYSVIVRGTVDGEPFELKVRESIQQRIELQPPLVIEEGSGPIKVTLLANVGAWFFSEDGTPLDPRLEDDADEIADRIDDTFRALGN
ncbi:MAG: hypothetical protein HKN04_14360, partial [Rhodothermaceae bacterium]|nr:hypothetical protein [Rhodothermaceae bacterium]